MRWSLISVVLRCSTVLCCAMVSFSFFSLVRMRARVCAFGLVFLLVLLFIWSILLYVHVRSALCVRLCLYVLMRWRATILRWDRMHINCWQKSICISLYLCFPVSPSHFRIHALCQESNNLKKSTLISEHLYGYIHKFAASLNVCFFTQILPSNRFESAGECKRTHSHTRTLLQMNDIKFVIADDCKHVLYIFC